MQFKVVCVNGVCMCVCVWVCVRAFTFLQAQTATKIVCICNIYKKALTHYASLTCALSFARFATYSSFSSSCICCSFCFLFLCCRCNLSDANGTPFACTAPQLRNQLDETFCTTAHRRANTLPPTHTRTHIKYTHFAVHTF